MSRFTAALCTDAETWRQQPGALGGGGRAHGSPSDGGSWGTERNGPSSLEETHVTERGASLRQLRCRC